jgi:hypothetical protein
MADDTVDTDVPLAVAQDTIVHIKSSNLFYLIHGLNRTVAGLTCVSGANVRPVLEKNEVRHRSHLGPLNRLLSVPVAFQLLHFWLGCCRDFVATHATLDGGNAGYGSSASIDMAVLARYLVIACMDLMAEGNRLNGPWRLARTQDNPDSQGDNDQESDPYRPLSHSFQSIALYSSMASPLMVLLTFRAQFQKSFREDKCGATPLSPNQAPPENSQSSALT